MPMELRNFGTTGLRVSALGLGAGEIGAASISERDVEALLGAALDLGINLIDTARGYGLSEERIGRHLAHRRHEFVLSTKVGYSIPGHADWTYGCVSAGVDEALRLLKTDHIDIVHLHSCPRETLERGEVIAALEEAVRHGKVRFAGYAGDNDALDYAIATPVFCSILTSVNICDQRILDGALPRAKARGMGVIAKRPVANAPWRFAERPHGHYAEEYWHRWKTMGLSFDIDWQELALRFTTFTYGVDTSIVGTKSIEHLRVNARHIEKGKLPDDIIAALRGAFRAHDRDWIGQI